MKMCVISNNLWFSFVIFVLLWDLSVAQREDNNDVEQRQFYKLGEFNERCRSTRDCRHFGYVCRDNRTCQCDYMYVPDRKRRSCVGGVNQRCIYDEHCIEGAFCMNQALCRCKDSSPIELEDGLVCSDSNSTQVFNWLFCALIIIYSFGLLIHFEAIIDLFPLAF